jgi:pilus assembly protein Flp/PilA
MDSVLARLGRLVVKDDGQDLVEYGLLVALIAVVAIAGVTVMGRNMYTVFWQVIGNAV